MNCNKRKRNKKQTLLVTSTSGKRRPLGTSRKKQNKTTLLWYIYSVASSSTCSSRSSTFLCQLSRALLSSCSLLCASWESAEAFSSSCSSFSSSRSFLHSCLQDKRHSLRFLHPGLFCMHNSQWQWWFFFVNIPAWDVYKLYKKTSVKFLILIPFPLPARSVALANRKELSRFKDRDTLPT